MIQIISQREEVAKLYDLKKIVEMHDNLGQYVEGKVDFEIPDYIAKELKLLKLAFLPYEIIGLEGDKTLLKYYKFQKSDLSELRSDTSYCYYNRYRVIEFKNKNTNTVRERKCIEIPHPHFDNRSIIDEDFLQLPLFLQDFIDDLENRAKDIGGWKVNDEFDFVNDLPILINLYKGRGGGNYSNTSRDASSTIGILYAGNLLRGTSWDGEA